MITGCNCTGGGKSKRKSTPKSPPKSKKEVVKKVDKEKGDSKKGAKVVKKGDKEKVEKVEKEKVVKKVVKEKGDSKKVVKKPSINNYKNINQKRKDSLLLIKAEFCPHCRDFVKQHWSNWTINPSKHINLISFDVATNNYRDDFLAKVIAKSPYVPAMYYIPRGSKGDDVVQLDISNVDRIEDLIYNKKR